MGLVRNVVVGLAGTGLAAGVAAGLGGFDHTTRDDNGNITGAGDISVFNIKVGDCLKDIDADGTVSESQGVPCTEPHKFEVFSETLVDSTDKYDENAINAYADSYCSGQYQEYVGISYEEGSLGVTYLTPTQDSWDGGDNEISCLLTDDEKDVSKSFKNSKM